MEYKSPGVYVEEVPSSVKPIAGAGTSTPVFICTLPGTVQVIAKGDDPTDPAKRTKLVDQSLPAAKSIGYYGSWSAFTAAYGGLVGDASAGVSKVDTSSAEKLAAATAATTSLHNFALAVYGFFNNGGGGCYIVRLATSADLDGALAGLEAIDDISLVVVPGLKADATDEALRRTIVANCVKLSRFAIFDGPSQIDWSVATLPTAIYGATDYAAVYFPWIKVFDPAAQLSGGDGIVAAPPSGHIAGVYARVDALRGVHKAPGNEAIFGAVGVSQALSKGDIGKLNPGGINCLRMVSGNVMVWGARTIGGDKNADLKYINVRRTLIFLRKSIEDGTQWIVFEPHTPALWQKINRNISAFLTQVWRSGALFGNTAAEAFYVKCDADTNPAASRDNGFVITEIGVALARPAEFVVFRIGQIAGAGG